MEGGGYKECVLQVPHTNAEPLLLDVFPRMPRIHVRSVYETVAERHELACMVSKPPRLPSVCKLCDETSCRTGEGSNGLQSAQVRVRRAPSAAGMPLDQLLLCDVTAIKATQPDCFRRRAGTLSHATVDPVGRICSHLQARCRCLRQSPQGAYTPRLPPWRSCQKWTMWRSPSISRYACWHA